MPQTTYQVFLSSDGKHTVVVTTDDVVLAKGAVEWARATYDQVVKAYGLKGEQVRKTDELSPDEPVPTCAVHGVPMVKVQGKFGPFWSCHELDANGNFCNYRPNGK